MQPSLLLLTILLTLWLLREASSHLVGMGRDGTRQRRRSATALVGRLKSHVNFYGRVNLSLYIYVTRAAVCACTPPRSGNQHHTHSCTVPFDGRWLKHGPFDDRRDRSKSSNPGTVPKNVRDLRKGRYFFWYSVAYTTGTSPAVPCAMMESRVTCIKVDYWISSLRFNVRSG